MRRWEESKEEAVAAWRHHALLRWIFDVAVSPPFTDRFLMLCHFLFFSPRFGLPPPPLSPLSRFLPLYSFFLSTIPLGCTLIPSSSLPLFLLAVVRSVDRSGCFFFFFLIKPPENSSRRKWWRSNALSWPTGGFRCSCISSENRPAEGHSGK